MITYKRPRGTQDFLPDKLGIYSQVQQVVQETFEAYGFQKIQTPMFEEFALFAARSGEDIREGMLTFICDDTEYALRPELTAPVCRLLATNELKNIPKPYKLYYIGQCFRYEKPREGYYREFRQAGLELMGSSLPIADAEVIAVASQVLNKLSIPYTLKIGNIAIFRNLLVDHGVNYDRQSGIINDMNKIMNLREKCRSIQECRSLNYNDAKYVKGKIFDLYWLQNEIGYEGEHKLPSPKDINESFLPQWLNKIPVAAEDIYKNFWVQKARLQDNLAELLMNIFSIRGQRDVIIQNAGDLVQGTSAEHPLSNLLEVTNFLDYFGISNYEIVLGAVRGIDYYTDTIFRIDCPLLEVQQICGGGRYDKLVAEFGGPEIPATGFAFGFGRVVEAFKKSAVLEISSKADIFVATTSDELTPKCIEIAEILRKNKYRVEIDIVGNNLDAQLDYASSIGCKYAIIISPDELQHQSISIRNMETKEQIIVPISGLLKAIKKWDCPQC
jgi:histidyl-tRNA synthetase